MANQHSPHCVSNYVRWSQHPLKAEIQKYESEEEENKTTFKRIENADELVNINLR